MKVLVTGGRSFSNRSLLNEVLFEIHNDSPISLLIHGAAKGADALADAWALDHGVETCPCPPDWRRFGKGAGVIRNAQMLDFGPDILIAFAGGRGTADMVRKAKSKGVAILEA